MRPQDRPREIKERLMCFLIGLKYKKRPSNLRSRFPSFEFFKNLAQEVKEEVGGTFIHCRSGFHRTNFAVQAIMILNNKKPLDAALAEIQSLGYSNFKPNYRFNIKKALGLITVEKIKEILAQRLDEFKKMFEEKQVPK